MYSALFTYPFTFAGLALETDWLKNIGTILAIILFIPVFAVSTRRLHDVNKSGWYMLVPIYNLILLCTEGTKGPNKYGENPKQIDSQI